MSYRLLPPLLVLALFTSSARAFVHGRTGPPFDKDLFWKAVTTPFVIDAAGSPDAPFDAVTTALRAAFAHWAEVPCSYLRFRDDGVRSGLGVAYTPRASNVNAVVFLEGTWIGARSAVAYTTLTFVSSTGELLDADIAFNGRDFQFSAERAGVAGRIDVEAVATHEVGHFLGLDHSPIAGATMTAVIEPGDTFQRDLSDDDVAGVCELYPPGSEPPPPPGPAIAGGCGAAEGEAAGGEGGLGAALLLATLLVRRRRARR